MTNPLVSIITPTYNHAQFIADCIQSVIDQTYTHWEMIIVDDGSTDQTLSIARAKALNDSRIQVFTQENIGIFRLKETYNFALSKTSGSYIAVLEGDDVWTKHKLEWQVLAMESQPLSVLSWGKAYSATIDLSANYQLYPLGTHSMEVYNNCPLYEASKQLIFGCFIPALTVMVRREALLRIGGFIQLHRLPLVDLPTWQQLSLIGTFVFVPEVLGKWRIYPHQVTKTHAIEMVEGFHLLASDFLTQCQPLGLFSSDTARQIRVHFNKMRVITYSRSGRYKLIRRDFQGARRDYIQSMFRFGWREPLWKLRSLIGFLFSWLQCDIESVARFFGRVSYKP